MITFYKTHEVAPPLAILLLFSTLPSLVYYLMPVGSFSIGMTMAGVVALFFAPRWKLPKKNFFLHAGEIRIIAVILCIGLHFTVAAVLLPVDASRFAGSLLLFVFMLVTASIVAPILFGRGAKVAARAVFWILAVCAGFAVAGLALPGAREFLKPVFPFSEPSHFALAFLPLLMWICVTTKGYMRHSCLLTGLAIALMLQNLTLVAGVSLVAAVYVSPLRILLLGSLVLGLVFALDPDLAYYTSRLDLSTESQNLSALVYLQGWQMIQESLSNSYGWGVGFQQLGINGTMAEAAQMIYLLLGDDSNLLDGGFGLVKVVSEFGVFAIIAITIYLLFAANSFRTLRAVALGRIGLDAGTVLAHAFIAMYCVEVFVRSAGYLTGTGTLFVASLMHLHHRRILLTNCYRSHGVIVPSGS